MTSSCAVDLRQDPNGPSPYVSLTTPDGTTTARVSTFGAHLLSLQIDGAEKLWMSSLSAMDGSGPIRGGVPIAFPQFADEGPLDKLHGFAREMVWEVEDGDAAHVVLGLRDDEASRSVWPHPFGLTYEVRLLDRGVRLHLRVENTDDENPLTFSGCLHIYFRFDDALDVVLHGFRNTKFVDKADGRKEKIQDGPIDVKVESDRSAKDAGLKHGFVDRIHDDSPKTFEFRGKNGKVLYKILQSDSWTDTTVYNPFLGDKQGPSFPDFDDDGYKYTICCEPTLSGKNAVTLRAGETWEGDQEILVPGP